MTTLTKAELELRKLELEVQKAEAEAAQDEEKRQHAAALRRIELREKRADLRKGRAEATMAEVELERALDVDAEEQRYADRREYTFCNEVGPGTVRACIGQLRTWSEIDPECDITITFNSPGGSVFDGIELGDFILKLRAEGHKVTCRVAGIAASMAGHLVQYGTERVITKSSYLHLHEVATMAWGKTSDLKDTAELAERLTRDTAALYASRSGGKHTTESVMDLMRRKEIYLSAEEALAHGFVDRVE